MPALKGDQVVAYHRLRLLSRNHQLTLLSFYESEAELSRVEELRPFCQAIHLVKLPRAQSLLNMTVGFVAGQPLQVAYYQANAYWHKLQALLNQQPFDLVHCQLLRMAPYLLAVKKPRLLELIDSMELNFEGRVAQERGWRKWLFATELRRIKRYEQAIPARFEAATVVSKLDKERIGLGSLEVIPLGVEVEVFKPSGQPKASRQIVFSGNMSYEPNVTAVRWFVEKCWPSIKAQVPAAEFVVAGANPSPQVLGLGQLPGVNILGLVPSMADTLRQAAVAVAPMQSGSGMQSKILEAMASGLPVVTTTLGLGDIGARVDWEIMVADDPQGVSQAVTRGESCEM